MQLVVEREGKKVDGILYLKDLSPQPPLRAHEWLVIMSDGAPWLWNMLNKFFPGAYETLDFYHLSEHINDCAKVLYGEGNKSGAR